MRFLRVLFVLPIRFYRRYVTPWTPPTCRFQPTCSAYGEQAILRHGVLKGSLLTIWRILRCQPFATPGPDPVPPPGAWRTPAARSKARARRAPAEGSNGGSGGGGEGGEA